MRYTLQFNSKSIQFKLNLFRLDIKFLLLNNDCEK